jgi:hypothetical protein
MFKRLVQAATITLLLNLLAHISPSEVDQPNIVSPSSTTPKLVMNLRERLSQ